jgi:glutamine---fructose-6-phosphate transaminase (isomerizing)
MVDETLPLVVICTMDSCYGKMVQVLQQLRARNANLVVICNQGDAEVADHAGERAHLVRVAPTEECLQPIVNIIPLQLLAYHLAVKRGFNVDQPRNLAKSVTVTEN